MVEPYHGLHIEFRQNLVVTVKFMRIQCIAISQLNPAPPRNMIEGPKTQDRTYARATSPIAPPKESKNKDLVYEKNKLFINILNPLRKKREIKNEETADLDSGISETFKKIGNCLLHREIPRDASSIKGFCNEIPQINI